MKIQLLLFRKLSVEAFTFHSQHCSLISFMLSIVLGFKIEVLYFKCMLKNLLDVECSLESLSISKQQNLMILWECRFMLLLLQSVHS